MNKTLEENNYILLDDFISADRAQEMFLEFKSLHKQYPEDFVYDYLCPKTPSLHDCWIFLELLLEKLPYMNELVGEILFPTYTYCRIYGNGDELPPHTDREACEISITLHLGSDGVEWPIYLKKPNGETVELSLKPGQAVLYLGCVATHWREKFAGQEYGQVFLHYVKARGNNRRHYFDKVRLYGN